MFYRDTMWPNILLKDIYMNTGPKYNRKYAKLNFKLSVSFRFFKNFSQK